MDYAHAPTERYSARDPFVPGNPLAAVLHVEDHNYWEIPIGIAVGKTFAYRNWTLTPQADATLIMALGNIGPYHTGFASRTGDGWKVHGIGSDGHWGTRLKAGVQAKYNDRMNVGLEYAFEARKRLQDHRISATVGWAF